MFLLVVASQVGMGARSREDSCDMVVVCYDTFDYERDPAASLWLDGARSMKLLLGGLLALWSPH